MSSNLYNVGLKSPRCEDERLSRGSDGCFALKQLSSASPTILKRKRRRQLVKYEPADSKFHPTILRPSRKKCLRKAPSSSQFYGGELKLNSKNSRSDSSFNYPKDESSFISVSPRPLAASFPLQFRDSTLPTGIDVLGLCSNFSGLSTFTEDLRLANPNIIKAIRRPVAIRPIALQSGELSSK
eukprot:CAMPEP_0185268234 /NCGR_PEP_ID=MMETSP1359-20130426/36568_1 /TAXON_ID=552665 /ORGANISM="Bigelowiella longifila, Strain CCMP242" /LENGTH=182 /DNA_ID=CAMNT_0027858919 /DNA_START=45 /DNA_END=593 /DNA_ORIENTATION=-